MFHIDILVLFSLYHVNTVSSMSAGPPLSYFPSPTRIGTRLAQGQH